MRTAARSLSAACIYSAAALGFCAPAVAAPLLPHILDFPQAQLVPLPWSALDGWAEDDHASALAAFQASCRAMLGARQAGIDAASTGAVSDARKSAMQAALEQVCRQAPPNGPIDAQTARRFFENHFRPVQISALGQETGLLTGYYEPIVEGSLVRSEDYSVPIHARPSNLVAFGRRAQGGIFPNRGPVGRRVGRKKMEPYHDRAAIEDGALAGRGLEIVWLKDPIDAFFLQIQGSARVQIEGGGTLRLNYAAHNGHPYTAVGRILIERGLVPREEMSMDRIRSWMRKNPEEGRLLRRANRSYVFMRVVSLGKDEEPIGAQGIPVFPLRTLAVDRKLHVYGTPFFIIADLPVDNEAASAPFRRLMIAQDTGSAIVGPARGDIYFGAGETLGRVAGRIRHQGRFVMLVPRTLELAVGAAKLPLPRPRPHKIAAGRQ